MSSWQTAISSFINDFKLFRNELILWLTKATSTLIRFRLKTFSFETSYRKRIERFPSTLQQENGVFECIHSGERFRKAPFSGDRRRRISVDERPNRIKKYPFSNENGLVWTGPKLMTVYRHEILLRIILWLVDAMLNTLRNGAILVCSDANVVSKSLVSTTVSSLYITMDNELVFFFNYPWHNWSAQRPRRENPPEMMSLLVLRWRPKSPTSFSISWKSEIQISHNILWHHWTTNHICRFLKGKLKKKMFSFHQCIKKNCRFDVMCKGLLSMARDEWTK